jgi:hypothetical protein
MHTGVSWYQASTSTPLNRARISDDEAMELVRENLIRLTWKDDRICAMLGLEFHPDHAGFGETVPQALRDLAAKIEKQDITVWVRRPVKQYPTRVRSKPRAQSAEPLRSSQTSRKQWRSSATIAEQAWM